MSRESYIKRMEEIAKREKAATPFWIDEHAEKFPTLDECEPAHGAFIRVVRHEESTDLPALRSALEIAVRRLEIEVATWGGMASTALHEDLERVYKIVGGGE